jgi:hypothetical protein
VTADSLGGELLELTVESLTDSPRRVEFRDQGESSSRVSRGSEGAPRQAPGLDRFMGKDLPPHVLVRNVVQNPGAHPPVESDGDPFAFSNGHDRCQNLKPMERHGVANRPRQQDTEGNRTDDRRRAERPLPSHLAPPGQKRQGKDR